MTKTKNKDKKISKMTSAPVPFEIMLSKKYFIFFMGPLEKYRYDYIINVVCFLNKMS
jgi:hypothetical protein